MEISACKDSERLTELDLLQFLSPKYAAACILTVNERLLSAISGHSEYSPSQTLAPKSALAALYVLDGDQQVAGKNN